MNTDMNSQTLTTTVSQPLPDEILTRFLKPDHDVLKNILTIWNLRGDLTQTGADRLRAVLGEEAYEHYNWDTAVSNGRVLLLLRRYKHPAGVRPRLGFHFPSEWFWCFSQMEDGEDTQPASAGEIAGVPAELRESLAILPELEWIKVNRVNYFEHGRGAAKKKHQKPPEGILFFRFTGGLGLSVATNNK